MVGRLRPRVETRRSGLRHSRAIEFAGVIVEVEVLQVLDSTMVCIRLLVPSKRVGIRENATAVKRVEAQATGETLHELEAGNGTHDRARRPRRPGSGEAKELRVGSDSPDIFRGNHNRTETLRTATVMTAVAEHVQLTADVQRCRNRGELGRRKLGQEDAEGVASSIVVGATATSADGTRVALAYPAVGAAVAKDALHAAKAQLAIGAQGVVHVSNQLAASAVTVATTPMQQRTLHRIHCAEESELR